MLPLPLLVHRCRAIVLGASRDVREPNEDLVAPHLLVDSSGGLESAALSDEDVYFRVCPRLSKVIKLRDASVRADSPRFFISRSPMALAIRDCGAVTRHSMARTSPPA